MHLWYTFGTIQCAVPPQRHTNPTETVMVLLDCLVHLPPRVRTHTHRDTKALPFATHGTVMTATQFSELLKQISFFFHSVELLFLFLFSKFFLRCRANVPKSSVCVCAMAAIEINGNEHKNYMLLRGVNYEWSNQKASLHFSLQFCCTRTCLLRTSAFMRFSAGTDARCHRFVCRNCGQHCCRRRCCCWLMPLFGCSRSRAAVPSIQFIFGMS